MVKNEFFWNNSKNIDIRILRKEQNLFRSEFYIWSKLIEKWSPKIQNGGQDYSIFDISTSDRGYFPRIKEIALFYLLSLYSSNHLVIIPFHYFSKPNCKSTKCKFFKKFSDVNNLS